MANTALDWQNFLSRRRSPSYRHEYRRGLRLLVPANGDEMDIGEGALKCVAFACIRRGGGLQFVGTVFLAVHPIEGTSNWDCYAITARHVVDLARRDSEDYKLCLRLNERDGKSSVLSTKISDWECHSDDRIDVAVLPLDLNETDLFDRFDHTFIGSDDFIVRDKIQSLHIKAGDDLYFPGLFSRAPGDESNIPIVRLGSVAALPKDPIKTPLGMAVAYLAEVRSIGGHSGSPVFLDVANIEKAWTIRKSPKADTLPLLGLVHGHWDIDGRNHDKVNSGIAMVVPAWDILDVLNQNALVDRRRQQRERDELGRDITTQD